MVKWRLVSNCKHSVTHSSGLVTVQHQSSSLLRFLFGLFGLTSGESPWLHSVTPTYTHRHACMHTKTHLYVLSLKRVCALTDVDIPLLTSCTVLCTRKSLKWFPCASRCWTLGVNLAISSCLRLAATPGSTSWCLRVFTYRVSSFSLPPTHTQKSHSLFWF